MASSSVARLRPSTVTVAPACESVEAMARPMPRPPPVTSACEERGSPDMHGPPRMNSPLRGTAYILDFKLLQEITPNRRGRLHRTRKACLTGGAPQVASAT